MQEIVYHTNYKLEDTYFWFLARNKIVLELIDKYACLEEGDLLLDVGCGTGGFAGKLAEKYRPICLDTSDVALQYCKMRGLTDVFHGTLSDFENVDRCPRAAIALDVIEHIENDAEFVKQINKLLPDKGKLVATVPAYKWLWSKHDEIHMHYRRYSKSQFKALLESSGFKIKYISYFNMFLFLPAALKRMIDKILPGKKDQSPIEETTDFLNKVFLKIFSSEAGLLKKGKLPFGLSIIAIAEKS